MKIVINNTYGGFSLSKEACQQYFDLKGRQVWIEDDSEFKTIGFFTVWLTAPENRMALKEKEFYTMSMEERQAYNEEYSKQTWDPRCVNRADPILVWIIEQIGELANGSHAKLKIVEIPDDVDWQIDEYDGLEHIAEKHRIWC